MKNKRIESKLAELKGMHGIHHVLIFASLLILTISLVYFVFAEQLYDWEVTTTASNTLFNRTTAWNSTGLIGWWKFDEGTGTSAKDSAGGNDGVLGGGAGWTNVAVSGNASRFDGINDVVNVSYSRSFDFESSQDFSITAWTRVRGTAGNHTIASTSNYVSPNAGWVFFATGNLEVQLNNQTAGAGFLVSDENINITDDTWHHVAFTASRTGNGIFYKDGILVGSFDISGAGNISSNQPLTIGKNNASGNFFNGTIDELKLWNRSLSADEVWQDSQRRSGIFANWTPRTAPYDCDKYTVALYHLDNSAGNACQDNIGSNNGTIIMTGTHDKIGRAHV